MSQLRRPLEHVEGSRPIPPQVLRIPAAFCPLLVPPCASARRTPFGGVALSLIVLIPTVKVGVGDAFSRLRAVHVVVDANIVGFPSAIVLTVGTRGAVGFVAAAAAAAAAGSGWRRGGPSSVPCLRSGRGGWQGGSELVGLQGELRRGGGGGGVKPRGRYWHPCCGGDRRKRIPSLEEEGCVERAVR